MIDFLKSWVINIITLVMLIILLEMLVPSGKVKKIVSLVAGFILIIAIISPLLNTLNKNIELKELRISETNFLDQKELEASANKLSKKQATIVFDTYKNKLTHDIEKSLLENKDILNAKASVILENNADSKEYGKIKKIEISVRTKEDSSNIKPVIAIEKITVGERGDKEREKNYDLPKALVEDIQNKMSKLFNITQEQVAVGGL